MATVYKAYQASLDRYVAIKILRPILLANPSFRQRFRQEALHIAALKQPNIVQVYEFNDDGDNCYIVMELIEGQTLQQRLDELADRGRSMPLADSLRLITEIGRALAYAHGRHMIHRDVKASNIMLTPDGRAILTDFGLAKLLAAPHMTIEGTVTGTPDYMAPEQILGKPLDNRTDIYSLGVLMYQLITGRLPFTADNEMGVLYQHVQSLPAPPHLFVPNLIQGLELLILKSLAKEPEQRYQTIEALLDDLARPEEITAPLVLPTSQPPPPSNIPTPLTSFIQREQEIAAITSRLNRPDVRLLTLIGFGGTGKTRLSLETANRMLPHFSDGVFFVNLSSLQAPSFLASAIGRTLGLVEQGNRPLAQELLAHLANRHMLLVLDNFEHIMEAASFVSELLAAAAHLKILVTSREPLQLYGEQLYQVPPMALPDLRQLPAFEDLAHYASIQMFITRAQAVDTDFALTPANARQVAELCVRLDGLPLAIELVAALLYSFTIPELAAQLGDRLALLADGPRDRTARQRTMRGAIDWSYDLLTPAEQRLFAQTGIFVGRFSHQAVGVVLGPSDLEPLIRKSLLQQEQDSQGTRHFRLLELLRDYALEKLAARQETETLRQKHADYYLTLVEQAEPHLNSSEQGVWFQQLEEAHDNFRAALHYYLSQGKANDALRLAGNLWRLWGVHSHLTEGSQWLKQALDQGQNQPAVLRAKAFLGAGRLALFQNKLEQARHFFTESLTLSHALSDPVAQANALNSLGETELQQEAFDAARHCFIEALTFYRAANDQIGVIQTLNNLGQMAYLVRDYQQAQHFLQTSLNLQREFGTPEATAITLNGLGEIARIQGQYQEAATLYEEALTIYREIEYPTGQALVLHNLGQVKLQQDAYGQAAVLFQSSLVLLRTMEEKVYIAWSLAGLGAAILNLDNPNQAVRLFSASQKLLQELGDRLDTVDQTTYEHHLAESRLHLSPLEWQEAWLEGQTMPLEQLLTTINFSTRTLTRYLGSGQVSV